MTTQIAAIVVAELVLLAVVVVVVAARLRDRERLRMEMQGRLIDRFTSPAELQQFLESEGGRRLLDTLDPRRRPSMARAVIFVQAGVIVGAAGVALLLLVALRPLLAGVIEAEDVPPILVAAILVLCLAGGLLLAAGVSRRLARTWSLEGPPAGKDDA